jgi:PIN domain nuclease of toxin-antitoxin system
VHQITNLDLEESSVSQLARLPPIHRDPFDRMLICKALQYGLTIATVDILIQDYSVKVI